MSRLTSRALLAACAALAAAAFGSECALLWETVSRARAFRAAALWEKLLPQLCNTLLLAGAALAFAVPTALFCAVWLLRTRKGRCKRLLLRMLSALAGIPTAVYGLFGYLVFGSTLTLGFSLLTGALTAALLLLPTTVFLLWGTLSQLGDGALRGALALGASEGRAVFGILLRQALPAIRTASLLAASRVAAESAALILTSGVGETHARGLARFLRSGATLSVGMYQSVLEGETGAAFSAGVLLLLLSLLLDTLTRGR